MKPASRRVAMPPGLHAAGAWCGLAGGAALLAAGLVLAAAGVARGQVAAASAGIVLLTMIALPAAMARRFGSRAGAPVAAALMLSMIATGVAAAAATRGAGSSSGWLLAPAALLLLASTRPLWRARRADAGIGAAREAALPSPRDVHRHAGWLRAAAPVALPALLAGLSSGVLARFQLFAICGAGAFAPSHALAAFVVATAGALLADRFERRRVLLALFAWRGALLAALTLDALLPFFTLAAPLFAVLDCVTIATLLRTPGAASATWLAGCSGAAPLAGSLDIPCTVSPAGRVDATRTASPAGRIGAPCAASPTGRVEAARTAQPASRIGTAYTASPAGRTASALAASHASCPGAIHHAGMLAGAALALTPWCFGDGFHPLFLFGGALNLVCAAAFAVRRDARHEPRRRAPPAFAPGSEFTLR
ncbi:hypothetical protein [Paraburkholderia caballeronis]|uniref:Major Facilitator Superfamily protein n=1 Tax=Paraburkholderia caballeronis TaxID=416943 RepID=A0A1H7U106_9BURK|nr:hypothetical protein [Paraburkholderia caballeronis]PXW23435.1 hypothetical protein C7403_110174 [Paraburkholderia caballeronis]PXW98428.1 hypothetical protein C7407_110174 [Paraburkholderia caballeronis]RAJ95159.1 hypothetical protein C7409_110175 [Paraburkholderia caballeronis]SEC53547.1 hypothetical protein SAMN05445871_2386 [Paraburkholderia caballeronis]SEL90356.1 hypothetical protein SAMN05192542_11764 [Paraburkholderia caballeronis]